MKMLFFVLCEMTVTATTNLSNEQESAFCVDSVRAKDPLWEPRGLFEKKEQT